MTPLREIVTELLSYAGWPRRERWLAELVVRVVAEKASMLEISCEFSTGVCSGIDRYINDALSDPDINITPEQFEEIKRRLKR